MEITGNQVIAAPRQTVWDALNDPAILKKCLPGCESVELTAPEQFKVVVTSAIGPLRARFNGTLKLTETDAPKSCVMVFEGQGGAIGFGKGTADVSLADVDGGTQLQYAAKAQVGGKLAQVGGRLIDSVAKKMSDDFFNAFRKQLVPEVAAVPAGASAPAAATATASAAQPAAVAGHAADASAAAAPRAAAVAAPAVVGVAPVVNINVSTPPPWAWIGVSFIAGLAIGMMF